MEGLSLLLADNRVVWILVLIVIDYILGFVAAIKKKEFRLGKVAKVMEKPVLAYLLGFAVVKAAAEAQPAFAGLVPLAWIIILAALIGSILNNLSRFDITIPDWLKK